jgi:hypothetical protein
MADDFWMLLRICCHVASWASQFQTLARSGIAKSCSRYMWILFVVYSVNIAFTWSKFWYSVALDIQLVYKHMGGEYRRSECWCIKYLVTSDIKETLFVSLCLSVYISLCHAPSFLPTTLMITMIMPMGRDYVSELRPPTGLLFIPQVIYEHGEPWWNCIHRGNLILPPDLSGNPTSREIW